MNTQKAIVILSTMALATIGGLLYLAMAGNVWATGILFSLWTVLMIVTGWGLSIFQQGRATAKEQSAFLANAKENLALMASMQSVQNRQNQTLMQQLGTVARLPQAGPGLDLSKSLLIEDGLFEELESGQ